MNQMQVAIYARVSSEQQTEAGTIASQLAALQEKVAQDGLQLSEELTFVDEGYSGSTLIRPALEQLRDVVALHGLERLYIHSPDRLARKYAYQVLLIDEFERAGVEIIFLNRALGQSPEDELLLQVQGMVAEYERAKILERSRRGKRHAAQSGQVSVLSGAPYGYRYISKQEGGGQARYEIVLDEARVVRQIFAWVGHERVSIQEVCRRLQQAGERTRTGKTTWDRTTVWGILKNPAYKGTAAFGKTKVGPMQPKLRPQRGDPAQPRRPVSTNEVPKEQWIYIPVPPLVILGIVLLIYLIGGCFVDSLGFLVLTIPIFFPLGMALGFDPVWYAIILTMVTTMGAITPPVGVNIYVVKALAPETELSTIFKGVSFFLLACIVCIIILVIFPQIVLIVPQMAG